VASDASQKLEAAQDGIAHRVAQRRANESKIAGLRSEADTQALVAFACECQKADCERSVTVPLYVYRRMVEAGNQYLLQAGHHAFASYRTILSIGLTRIEERA
jgi:hypothetical protein